MATKLEIIIAAKDQASNVLKRVSGSLGRLSVVGAAGTAALVGGVGAVGVKLLQLGASAEEMQAKFDTVFGVQAQAVTQQLSAFAAEVGRNRFELQGYASTLQDTLVPMGLTEEAAADFSVQLVKLGTDLSSFNNMPMDEALRRLQGTLVGSHENALAFGVVINENTLKAELAAQGWDTLTGAQLEAAKVQARINLLMAGTSAAQGDAARTSESFTNQMRAATASIQQTATAMGLELIPVITPMIQSFASWVSDVGPRAIEIFSQFAATLGETLGPASVVVNDALTRIGAALGLTSGNVTGTDVALKALGATLDAIVIGVQAFAVAMQAAAAAAEALRASADFVMAGGLAGQVANPAVGQTGAVSGAFGLGGVTINMDGQQVGAITAGHQGNTSRQVRGVGGPATQ